MISIGDGSFANSKGLALSHLDSFESFEIGDECFGLQDTFTVEGLNALLSLKIGMNSFTQKKDDYGNEDYRSFHILNCGSLESIEIGRFSFSDYAGEFELSNLPSLQSLRIGSINETSFNFYASSFEIESRNCSCYNKI